MTKDEAANISVFNGLQADTAAVPKGTVRCPIRRPRTRRTTTSVAPGAAPRSPRVLTHVRARAVDAANTTGAAVSAGPSIRLAHRGAPVPSARSPSAYLGRVSAGPVGSSTQSCPETTNPEAKPRWVTGIPASAETERHRFFATSAEHIRVAARQAGHAASPARGLHPDPGDRLLTHPPLAGAHRPADVTAVGRASNVKGRLTRHRARNYPRRLRGRDRDARQPIAKA